MEALTSDDVDLLPRLIKDGLRTTLVTGFLMFINTLNSPLYSLGLSTTLPEVEVPLSTMLKGNSVQV